MEPELERKLKTVASGGSKAYSAERVNLTYISGQNRDRW